MRKPAKTVEQPCSPSRPCLTGWTAMGMPVALSVSTGLHCLNSALSCVRDGLVTACDSQTSPRCVHQGERTRRAGSASGRGIRRRKRKRKLQEGEERKKQVLTLQLVWSRPGPRSYWGCNLSLQCWWSEPPTSRLPCRVKRGKEIIWPQYKLKLLGIFFTDFCRAM